MPKRKRKNTTYKSRKRRRPRRRKRIRKPLPLNGFPTRYVARHRFAQVISLNPSTAGVATYTFRANSLYDPEYTAVTGGQPRGYDQISALYNHYTVVGAKISVKPCGPQASSANEDPTAIYGVSLSAQHTFEGTDWTDIAEQRYGGPGRSIQKHIMMSRSVNRKFSAKKFFGIPKGIVGEDIYRGTTGNVGTGSNPDEGAYFHVWCCSPNDLSDVDPTSFTVIIDYIAIYTEPKIMVQS